MWTDFINDALLPALIAVLTAFVTTLTGVAVAAVNKWAQKQKAEWVGTVMLNLTLAAQRAVLKTNQVFADDLRSLTEDGKLSAEDARAALEMAKRTMREEISAELWEALLRIAGDTMAAERVIESLIESQVGAVKKSVSTTG